MSAGHRVCAQIEASLFSSMLLVDPMVGGWTAIAADALLRHTADHAHRQILKDQTIRRFQATLSEGAIRRQSIWPTRSAARTALSKSKLFAAMDPRQLDVYLEYGLKAVDGGQVALMTPPWCEAATFADGWTSFQTFGRLPDLKASKGVHLVDATESGAG